MELTQFAKYLIAKTSDNTQEVKESKVSLGHLNVNSDLRYRDFQQEMSSEKLVRRILKNKLSKDKNDIIR